MSRYVDLRIEERERSYLDALEANPDDLRLRNRLGVLYARFGRYDEALSQFRAIVEKSDYAPGFINIANIEYLRGKYVNSLESYESARRIVGDEPEVLLGLAQVSRSVQIRVQSYIR